MMAQENKGVTPQSERVEQPSREQLARQRRESIEVGVKLRVVQDMRRARLARS